MVYLITQCLVVMFVSWKIGEKGKKIDGYVCSMRMQRKEDEKKKKLDLKLINYFYKLL